MTRQQIKNLKSSEFTFEVPEMHFEKFAPLSLSVRAAVEEDLHIAESAQNTEEVTLIHTGIPSLEKSIIEYMNKYALANKIKEAVETFKNKIDEKNLMAQLEESWQKNDAERQKMNRQLQIISEQLAKGNEAAKFKKKIEAMDITGDIKTKIRQIRAKCDKEFGNRFPTRSENTVTPEEARKAMDAMKKLMPGLQDDIQTDLEKVIDESIIQTAKNVLNEYKSYVQDIMPKSSVADGDKFFSVPKQILTLNLPNVNDVVDRYTEKKIEKITVQDGEKKRNAYLKNIEEKGASISTIIFGLPDIFKTVSEPNYVTIDKETEFVNLKKIIDEYFYPLRKNMNENIQKIGEVALEQAEEFKEYFVSELDKLDRVIQTKIQDMQNTTRSKEQLDAKIKQDEDKKVWLDNFKKQLDEVLKV